MSYKLKAGHYYSFGDWVFPAPEWKFLGTIVETYQEYSFIVRIDGEFYFFHSDYYGGMGLSAWYEDDGYLACWSKITEVWKYDGSKWVEQDDTPYRDESIHKENRGGYLICPKECLVWAASDVRNMVGYSLYLPDYDGTYMEGSIPVYLGESAEDILNVIAYGWNSDGNVDTDVPEVKDGTLPLITGEDAERWRIQATLIFYASTAEGNSITVKWYKNGVLWDEVTTKTNIYYRKRVDREDATGEYTYHAEILVNGISVRTMDAMTFTVIEWDLPNNKPTDGSGDGSGGGSGGYVSGGSYTGDFVGGISISMSPDTVRPGGHAYFDVAVTGYGNYSSDYTLELTMQESPDTQLVAISDFMPVISDNRIGCIVVAEDETADFVMLTATSTQDSLIQTTEMLYIDHSAVEGGGTTPEQLQIAFWKGHATARAYFQKVKLAKTARISITLGEEPDTEAGLLKRAFWKGFVACLGALAPFVDSDDIGIVAFMEGDVLYIKNANGTMDGSVLEVK